MLKLFKIWSGSEDLKMLCLTFKRSSFFTSFEQHSMSDFKSVARKRVIQIFEPKNALT